MACWVCFSPGVGAGFLFDDATTVQPVQILRSNPDYFWYVVFSDKSGPLGRPLTILTFAVEQVMFAATPEFSQRVGIALHAINSLLVCALLFSLLRLVNARKPLLLASLAALLWACTPQKASTVLYIVQRMASLTCFFALLAMLGYVLARTATSRRSRTAAWALCLSSVLAAPFAKEVGALVPFYLALLELLLLAPLVGGRFRIPALLLLGVGALGFAALGLLEYNNAELRYSLRNFGLADRLLSAPAVIVDYLRQFFVPDTGRLGLIHDDYQVVTDAGSLLRFWLPLLPLALAATWIARCLWRGEADLVAAGLALFLLGHSLEGSFIPLEIYFEHRNYTPSIGLCIALVGILARLNAREATGGVGGLANVALFVLALSLVFSCWNFTERWSSRTKLLQHHLAGHPRSSRVHSEFALGLADAGRYTEAMTSIQRAYDFSRSEPAARALNTGDLGLLRVAAACYAGESLTAGLPPIDAVIDHPIRSSVGRSLRKLVEQKVCADGDWVGVSAWVKDVVAAGERAAVSPLRFKASVLQDLANFERALENYLEMYIYASMASELKPDNVIFVMLKMEASLETGDAVAYESSSAQLRALVERGGLSVVERTFLEYAAPALLGIESEAESTPPGVPDSGASD